MCVCRLDAHGGSLSLCFAPGFTIWFSNSSSSEAPSTYLVSCWFPMYLTYPPFLLLEQM